MSVSPATEREVSSGEVRLAVSDSGSGVPVVLLHGLTATRRYVVMGSRALERTGHRVLAYDARGHGASTPAPHPDAYTYADLGGDLVAVLEASGIERAVLAGGLERGGIDGFLAAYGPPAVAERWRETVLTVIRQRLSLHAHLDAVAQALRVVPRSRPFGELAELEAITVPVTVVASNDEADPGHPQALGEAYAAAIPGAELVLDPPGSSPVAWQGSQLSRVIAGLAERAASTASPGD